MKPLHVSPVTVRLSVVVLAFFAVWTSVDYFQQARWHNRFPNSEVAASWLHSAGSTLAFFAGSTLVMTLLVLVMKWVIGEGKRGSS